MNKTVTFVKEDTIEWNDSVLYIIFRIVENGKMVEDHWLRVWCDEEDHKYCYQMIYDDGRDIDIVELSGAYVDDELTEANLLKYYMKEEK